MGPWSRRKTLQLASAALAASALPGCASRPAYKDIDPTGHLIDAHCHLFNGTDLPITTFLTRLALRQYDDPDCDLHPDSFRSLSVEDPTFVESLIDLLVRLLLGNTLTAREERALLEGNHTTTEASEKARVRSLTERKLATFLAEPSVAPATARDFRDASLRDALRQEAEAAVGNANGVRTLSTGDAAAALVRSGGPGGKIIRWVMLFFRSRQSLGQELIRASGSWGRPPLMLVPMMVDYAHWLGQTTQPGSSFFDQTAVYAALCRRSPVPVHGMVPFDPLRSVFWTEGRHGRFETPEFDPLALAEEALTQHGFLGLKLYPPMGFQATGNAADDAKYPVDAIKALNLPKNSLGPALDAAMIRAFDFCLRHDAPMLAHANNSVAAGKGYGRRADPWFWIRALRDRPGLRICLAHGGGFCWASKAPGLPAGQTSWEWAIGRYIRDNTASHLYMDLSYFSEILESGSRTGYITAQLKAWIRDCDPDVRHIIFGTDWIMLDKEPKSPFYGKMVMDFLTQACGLNETQLNRVMWQNAMHFLGLDSGKTRDRLLAFYNGRRPPWTQIPPSDIAYHHPNGKIQPPVFAWVSEIFHRGHLTRPGPTPPQAPT
jgi:predicted TIM-barrel fold metal-dependent hydrolase